MLRLIATISHGADECDIKESDLCSLLRISYVASQKIREVVDPFDESGLYTSIERHESILRSPMHTVFTEETVDPPLMVAAEGTMGPTALVGLLTILARRGLLEVIPGWTELPSGTSLTSLSNVKQITSPDIIGKVITSAFKRVIARKNDGKRILRESGDEELARVAFANAAELATALITFDNATQRKWAEKMKGVHKELVSCLGSVSEIALKRKEYKRALNFALYAVKYDESAPQGEAVDKGIIAIIKGRVDEAKQGLL